MKQYEYKKLNNPNRLSESQMTVGVMINTITNKPILFLDVITGLQKRTGQSCVLVGEREADKIKGEYYGLVYIDHDYYQEACLLANHEKAIVMEELGYYLQKDYQPYIDVDELALKRREAIKRGCVLDSILSADRFAVEQAGRKEFIETLDYLIGRRKKHNVDANKDLGVRELELRRGNLLECVKQ